MPVSAAKQAKSGSGRPNASGIAAKNIKTRNTIAVVRVIRLRGATLGAEARCVLGGRELTLGIACGSTIVTVAPLGRNKSQKFVTDP
jgi:hypothetical protein